MATAKKKPGTALVAWDEKLAERAARAKKVEASVSTGNFLSVKAGVMNFAGNAVPGNTINVVVLDAIIENAYYEGKFDPNNPTPPSCYAFGRDDDDMAPHENVEQPFSDSCKGCPNNEWGSADTGRGKACKNVRRLGLMAEDALERGAEGIAEADIVYLKVPVTSVKGWAGYVNQLAATNKPPLAFVTEVSVVPDDVSQFKVNFRVVEEIDDGELIEAILNRADIVENEITFPYQHVEQAPAKPVRGRAQPRQTTPARAAPAARTQRKAPPAKEPAAATPPARSARRAAPAATPAPTARRKF